MKCKRPRIVKTALKRNKKLVLGLTLFDYKAAVIKKMYLRKHRRLDQRNRKSPEIHPHIYGNLIFNKGRKQFSRLSFQHTMMKKIRYLYKKLTTDLHVRPKTIKF